MITEMRKERATGGRKFWRGLCNKYPEWEAFLRGETETPPGKEALGQRTDISLAQVSQGQEGELRCSDPRYNEMISEITMIMNSDYRGIKEALAQNVREFAQAVRDKNEIEGLKKSQAKDHETILRLVEKVNHMEDYINQITHPGEPLTGTETDG